MLCRESEGVLRVCGGDYDYDNHDYDQDHNSDDDNDDNDDAVSAKCTDYLPCSNVDLVETKQ